jgi:hypothetical protein
MTYVLLAWRIPSGLDAPADAAAAYRMLRERRASRPRPASRMQALVDALRRSLSTLPARPAHVKRRVGRRQPRRRHPGRGAGDGDHADRSGPAFRRRPPARDRERAARGACRLRCTYAQRRVAEGLASGVGGWPHDPAQALSWMKRALVAGSVHLADPAIRLRRRLRLGWEAAAHPARGEALFNDATRDDALALARQLLADTDPWSTIDRHRRRVPYEPTVDSQFDPMDALGTVSAGQEGTPWTFRPRRASR